MIKANGMAIKHGIIKIITFIIFSSKDFKGKPFTTKIQGIKSKNNTNIWLAIWY
ncbi:hypothetical protein JCM14036_16790 [Desulfotomaculum defluvii]